VSSVQVRPFTRADREQVTTLVNAPGVYGVPEQWPHVRAIYERAGFRADDRTEVVFLAAVGDYAAFLAAVGCTVLTRTTRGLTMR
jgi:hypothetical protein